MPQKRRLQVFISSTFTDLVPERQAAVAAILKTGHIPAGMELFAAGDQSQLETIRRWIDQSDAFMLILGGRYGSIEPESQLSYTELEYDYAIQSDKPFFAVVIEGGALEARVVARGSSVLEKDNPAKLKAFRDKVLSRMSAFFSDERDVRLAVHETLSDFVERYEFGGWIAASDVPDTKGLVDRVSTLTEENRVLAEELGRTQDKLATLNASPGQADTFESIAAALAKVVIDIPEEARGENGPEKLGMIRLLRALGESLIVGVSNAYGTSSLDSFLFHTVLPKLQVYDFAESEKVAGVRWRRFSLNKRGARFLRYLNENEVGGSLGGVKRTVEEPASTPAPKAVRRSKKKATAR